MEQEIKEIKELQYSVEKELPSMLELFSIQSYTGKEGFMKTFINNVLSKIEGVFFKEDTYGNILITKGEISAEDYYPCIIAHMDTVHDFVKGYSVNVETEDNYTKVWATCSQYQETPRLVSGKNQSNLAGIGGDDKCGIWIALKLLEELPTLKVIFTVEEESGAVGASNLDSSFFDNVGYLIEGDRKGNSDLITNIWDDICSREFLSTISNVMEEYQYNETFGMLTDIAAIKEDNINLSAVNVSVGYYNPHSKEEFIIIEDLLTATSFIRDCIEVLGYKKYEHTSTYPKKQESYAKYYEFDSFIDEGINGWDYPFNKTCNCSSKITDLSCDTHNKILLRYSGEMCSCGEELEEREYSYNCPFCTKIYM